MSENGESWRSLLYEFTQDTTLHGVRFTTRPTPYVIRRILWTIAFFACFGIWLWFVLNQLVFYMSNPKAVNVDVIFTDKVDFPTVTICNQNLFKRSLAHKYGLHDVIVDGFTNLTTEDGGGVSDSSSLEETVRDFNRTENVTLGGNALGVIELVYQSVTVEVCKMICIRVVSDSCCSLLYDKIAQTCRITALEPAMPGVKEVSQPNTDYYRRNRCIIKKTAECDFGNEVSESMCNFQVDIKRPLQWKIIQGYGRAGTIQRPDFDHTERTNLGHFIYASKNRKSNVDAHLLSPYFVSNNTCVEFYYQNRKGFLKVYQGLREDVHLIWKRSSTSSSDWERGYVSLPDGYIRVIFVASDDDGINIALDDIKISACKPNQLIQECRTSALAIGYRGKKDMSISGQKCARWDDIEDFRIPESWYFESLNRSEEANYCRNPDSDSLGPWCIVDSDTLQMSYCDIKLCDCQDDREFECPSRCISKEQTCNLKDDCGDLSDEAGCQPNEIAVNCTFQVWNCSYSSPEDARMKWVRVARRDESYMTVEKNNGREGDFAMLMSPGFTMFQTGCLEMRYNLSQTDKLDLFTVANGNTMYREHVCTLDGIDHVMYEEGLDPYAPAGYNISIDIPPGEMINLLFIGNVANQDLSSIILYQIKLWPDINCTELYAPVIEIPTTMMTMNYTMNDTMWNITTEEMTTASTEQLTTTEYLTTTTEFYDVNATVIPIYQPECKANSSNSCDSCIKDAFFWEKLIPNNTDHEPPECSEEFQIECSFSDKCLCGYKFSSSNKFWVWELDKLSNFTDNENKVMPQYQMSDDNYLRVLNLSEASRQGDWLRLMSPIQNFTETSCLKFFYFSRYMEVKVYMYNETSNTLQLQITFDGQERHWHTASTNIPPGRHGVVFQLTYSQYALKNAGIDNVTLSSGLCEAEATVTGTVNCTFENNDWCGYADVSIGPRNWYRTLGSDSGKYFLRTRNIDQGKVSRQLQSPLFYVPLDSCLRFDFFDSAGDSNQDSEELKTLAVSVKTQLGQTRFAKRNIWRIFGTMRDNFWHYAHARIPAGAHHVLFEVNGNNYRVGIRNITVSPAPCPIDYVCNSTGGERSDWWNCNEPNFACVNPDIRNDKIANCADGEDETLIEDSNDGDVLKFQNGNTGNGQSATGSSSSTYLEEPITSLRDMYRKVGHQGDDMIYKCQWNGEKCTSENFTQVITDYGLCYMFNSAEIPVSTSKTGARFGLILTLNIEQYESMIGPNTDAGIKVFLHSSKEEPQVRDLGFAISPGQHALIGIQRNDADNLEMPYGNCTTKALKYKDTYTYSACEVECETDELVANCNCRDAYMPGYSLDNPKVCDIERYFSCAVPTMNEVAKNLEDDEKNNASCKCPQPCYQVVYQPSLSYALLSTMSVNQILTRPDFDLKGRYTKALETRERVDYEKITNDLEMLSSLERQYLEMQRLVVNFLNNDTNEATAMLILNAVGQMKLLADEDFATLLDEVRVEYRNYFNEKFDDPISLALSYHGRLLNSSAEVDQLLYISQVKRQKPEYLTDLSREGKMYSTLSYENLEVLFNTMLNAEVNDDDDDGANTQLQEDNKYAPKFYFKDPQQCSIIFQEVKNSLLDLQGSFGNIENIAQRSGWSDTTSLRFQLDENIKNYRLKFGETEKCLFEYLAILNEVEKWFSDNDGTETLRTIADDEKSLVTSITQFESQNRKLLKDTTTIQTTNREYSREIINKQLYLQRITEVPEGESASLKTSIDTFATKLNQEIQKLLNQINQGYNTLLKKYREVFDLAIKVDSYMPENYFYQKTSNMKIWRLPGPNLAEPKDPLYYRETLEMWKIWDSNMKLWNFVRCHADMKSEDCTENLGINSDGTAIRDINAALIGTEDYETNKPPGYFKTIRDEIDQFQTEVKSVQDRITQKINEINTEKVNFNRERQIDSMFIQQNFLNIDVYFQQLKYQIIKQIRAYTILDFISDVGGYIGLLLGASVLTLCEIIDLFLYNGVLRGLTKSTSETDFTKQRNSDNDLEANGKTVQNGSSEIPDKGDLDASDGLTNYGVDGTIASSQFNKL